MRSSERNDDEIGRLVTFLVRLPDQAPVNPLRVALVLPVTGPPSLRPDGTTTLDADLRTRVQVLTNVLTANPSVAFTTVVQPELLESLSRTGLPTDAQLRADLIRLLAGRQTLLKPERLRLSYEAVPPLGLSQTGALAPMLQSPLGARATAWVGLRRYHLRYDLAPQGPVRRLFPRGLWLRESLVVHGDPWKMEGRRLMEKVLR